MVSSQAPSERVHSGEGTILSTWMHTEEWLWSIFRIAQHACFGLISEAGKFSSNNTPNYFLLWRTTNFLSGKALEAEPFHKLFNLPLLEEALAQMESLHFWWIISNSPTILIGGNIFGAQVNFPQKWHIFISRVMHKFIRLSIGFGNPVVKINTQSFFASP